MLLSLENLINKYNCKINGVVHIGGHHGEEHESYKKYNIQNIIYFEPMKSSFEILKNKVKDEAIVINKALGNDNKKVQMNVEKNNQGQSSSILNPKIHLQQYPWIQFTDKEEVEMIKLDDFEFNKNNYNFINIDVQGYELEVFKGAKNTLNNINYIVSEVNRAEVYEGCPHIKDLCDFLKEFNFELEEVVWAGETWGDAFFKKYE